MKIIYGSLSGLLVEVKERGKVDDVRVAALMQSTVEGAGLPRYTSWVIVCAALDWRRGPSGGWWSGGSAPGSPSTAAACPTSSPR